jgi:xanthine dehydrogenase YagR molybdenum-binding subunit
MNQTNTNKAVGKAIDRVDGRLKVTGAARYSGEIPLENITHAVIISSTIARGRIKNIDTSTAEKYRGVISIITYKNAPKLKPVPTFSANGPAAENRLPLQNAEIHHSGQHIGVVIADTLEHAKHAATLVRVEYEAQRPLTEMARERNNAVVPKVKVSEKPPDVVRGNPNQGLAEAQVRVEQTYRTPEEHHNPMETHATTAVWQGNRLTVYDATQYNFGTRQALATTLGVPEENVRVVCQFIGGAFGCKGSVWPHVTIAAIAAQKVGRPVKLVLTRQQMFTSVGHRAETEQKVALGATRDGRLTAIQHTGISHTSTFDEFVEPFTIITHMLYATPNLQASQRLVKLNKGTPTFMRAPGETPGTFALESAMDEMAYTLKLDPIELRLRNYAETDPDHNRPWSSKSLKECYRIAAEKIGWSRRNPQPRSMRDGRYLVGMGMATATYPVYLFGATAKVRILQDGSVVVQSGSQEMGTGTATAMAQVAADVLGVPFERVRFELGDTALPKAPVSGGSATMGSVGTAVHGAVKVAQAKLLELARADSKSPLYNVPETDIAFEDGRIFVKSKANKSETYADILKRQNLPHIEESFDAKFDSEKKPYSSHAFGAQFAEVKVDPDTGEVRVTRFVGAYGVGKVINAKTARSQIIGGVTMGIGMALHEETITDARTGRIINANLGEYHVPVNADIPDIEPYFVDEIDPHINGIGAKGIGEIGITGVAAAVANAVYHATGKRIRDLPITPDKLL